MLKLIVKFVYFNIKYIVDYGFEFGIAFTDVYGRPLVLDPRYFTLDISQTTTYKSGDIYHITLCLIPLVNHDRSSFYRETRQDLYFVLEFNCNFIFLIS